MDPRHPTTRSGNREAISCGWQPTRRKFRETVSALRRAYWRSSSDDDLHAERAEITETLICRCAARTRIDLPGGSSRFRLRWWLVRLPRQSTEGRQPGQGGGFATRAPSAAGRDLSSSVRGSLAVLRRRRGELRLGSAALGGGPFHQQPFLGMGSARS